MLLRTILLLILFFSSVKANELKNCPWKNKKGIPCITITKTPNSSVYSERGINKKILTKEEIIKTGALDINDVLKLIPGLDIFQSGQRGQQTSIFTRGAESNHTLVLLNGVAINDQSVTDGLHDFGQDFIQTIQQIEVYKGPSGSHFGPNAIAGAINIITAIDYTNSIDVNGFNDDNNSLNVNYTKITDNEWHLNFKASNTKSKTGSAIAAGNEDDGSINNQFNFNSEKWLKENLKFKSTLYTRKTKSDYDSSSTDEDGYISDNRMYAFQSSLDQVLKNSNNNLIFHYHKYDREYENGGYLDEYDSESFVIKGEKTINPQKKFSYGYGSEYKYDWGAFENRGSYNASTKGHMKDLGIFGNFGYKFNNNSILSLYGRSDNHNTAGRNESYKINLKKFINEFTIGITHSTGLRNPTLYELYGTDNYGIKGNINLKSEKSRTNEFSAKYDFNKNLIFNSTAYRTTIYDQIETNSAYTMHENQLVDINQEGLESSLLFKGVNQSILIFSNLSKSRKTNGQAQSRRPDLTYGINLKKELQSSILGPINLNLNFKHTGKYIDWDGSKNSRQKSTDILDMSFTKNLSNYIISLNISNMLNEDYEKPATYAQDGRRLRIGFRKLY